MPKTTEEMQRIALAAIEGARDKILGDGLLPVEQIRLIVIAVDPDDPDSFRYRIAGVGATISAGVLTRSAFEAHLAAKNQEPPPPLNIFSRPTNEPGPTGPKN